jgi:post-segregation antitoxin (ccd killing protein)
MTEGKKLTRLVDRELVKQAKTLGINISRTTENPLTDFIRSHTHMHLRSPS